MKKYILIISTLLLANVLWAQQEQPKESARQFVDRINKELIEISGEIEAAFWVRATYITPDTAILASKASEKWLAFQSKMIEQSKQYQNLSKLDKKTQRSIQIIKSGVAMPAPKAVHKQKKLAQINTELEGMYGAGKYCKDVEDETHCQDLGDLSKILAKSRDYSTLLEAWSGWRTISPPMKDMYAEFVTLMNDGAREMGFEDTGDLWKSGYDMPAQEFEQVTDTLWGQVKPLYKELHCYVGNKLAETYGRDKVDTSKPLPAHLFGNMWAQQWGEIYDLVEPYPGELDLDVTKGLVTKEHTPVSMTKMAEGFFTSLGLPSLPESFYKNSMLKKPRDRDVVCHASAWDMDNGNDPRIKQCIEPTEEELITIHHELGHIYYYIMYKGLKPLFKGGAHDGFHEAIGDTVELSMTPEYLNKMGLVGEVELSEKAIINKQLKLALNKIAFLPFGKMIDQWRWLVFSGNVSPEQYNDAWWELRRKFQGIDAPIARADTDFDPGAKYHIPGNTPYTRYFLAHIMQFQFHQALCKKAGHKGPLHECSIYGNEKAGKLLKDMLAMGQSKPWPKAMKKVTGQSAMSAKPIIDYFAPLMGWLKKSNEDKQCLAF